MGEAKLRYGAAIMPVGRRRDTLTSDIESMLHPAFEGRILPFDSNAAAGTRLCVPCRWTSRSSGQFVRSGLLHARKAGLDSFLQRD